METSLRSLSKHVASLTWVVLRSFVLTVLALTLLGGVLAGVSYFFLRDYPWYYGGIAAVAAIIESLTVGVLLGMKRAMASAATHGLGTLRLGRSVVRLVFERILGIAEEEESTERGGKISEQFKRLPLAQAEELLGSAVRDVIGDAEQGGWLRRKIGRRLLEAIRKYTLARFREEGAEHGGIDLLKVKEELEQTVDDVLLEKVRGGLRLGTVLMITGLLFVVAVQTWVILMLAPATG